MMKVEKLLETFREELMSFIRTRCLIKTYFLAKEITTSIRINLFSKINIICVPFG
jgi:hypothetical protein